MLGTVPAALLYVEVHHNWWLALTGTANYMSVIEAHTGCGQHAQM